MIQFIFMEEGICQEVDDLAIEKGVLRREIWYKEVKLMQERNTNWVGEKTAQAEMDKKQAAMTINEIKFAILEKKADTIVSSLKISHDMSNMSIL